MSGNVLDNQLTPKERGGRIKREGETYSGFSIIGSLKVGEKKQISGGREIPTSLDYFKPVGKYEAMFEKEFGPKPSTVPIVFISDEYSQSCFEEWEARDEKGRKAGYSDGMTYFLYNPTTEVYEECVSQEEVKEYTSKNKLKWNVVLTLYFIIPRIRGVFGLWKYSTKGNKSSVLAIRQTFDWIQKNVGTVVNIPFDLSVQKVKSQKPGNNFLFPVVSLVPNLSPDNLESLSKFIASGHAFRKIGVLTEAKILEMENQSKQLTEGAAETKDAVKEEIVNTDTGEILDNTDVDTLETAINALKESRSIPELQMNHEAYEELYGTDEQFQETYKQCYTKLAEKK